MVQLFFGSVQQFSSVFGFFAHRDRVDDLQEKFDEMQREVKALRGKELFGKDAYDLCLVLNV